MKPRGTPEEFPKHRLSNRRVAGRIDRSNRSTSSFHVYRLIEIITISFTDLFDRLPTVISPCSPIDGRSLTRSRRSPFPRAISFLLFSLPLDPRFPRLLISTPRPTPIPRSAFSPSLDPRRTLRTRTSTYSPVGIDRSAGTLSREKRAHRALSPRRITAIRRRAVLQASIAIQIGENAATDTVTVADDAGKSQGDALLHCVLWSIVIRLRSRVV